MEEGNEIILKMFNCPVSKNKTTVNLNKKDNRRIICFIFQYEKNTIKKRFQ